MYLIINFLLINTIILFYFSLTTKRCKKNRFFYVICNFFSAVFRIYKANVLSFVHFRRLALFRVVENRIER